MKRGGKRGSTREDLALWEAVARTVKPLGRRRPPVPPARKLGPAGEADKPPEPDRKAEKEKRPRAAAKSTPAPKPTLKPTPAPPHLAPLERRMRARVVRGGIALDARLDLHGMTQQAAHERLRRFLAGAQTDGARLVLVITGKGKSEADDMIGAGRGVLRRSVPLWLGAADLRAYVIGFETAGPRHGGEGALYVRIRSRRP